MKRYLWLLIPIGLTSCVPKKGLQSNAHTTDNCGIEYGGWTKLIDKKIKPKTDKQHVPTQYVVYTVDNNKLKPFMLNLKDQKQKSITLPSMAGSCTTYNLEFSETMSPELAAKYPEIQSYKGNKINDQSESIRVDYDGVYLRVSITNNDGNFILDPFETADGTYYLLFDKNNSGLPKGRFE